MYLVNWIICIQISSWYLIKSRTFCTAGRFYKVRLLIRIFRWPQVKVKCANTFAKVTIKRFHVSIKTKPHQPTANVNNIPHPYVIALVFTCWCEHSLKKLPLVLSPLFSLTARSRSSSSLRKSRPRSSLADD